MDDLKRFRVPVLILSGGEPLLRPDIFDIAQRAKEMGFYVGLSSNGTLIDESNIDRIAAVGFDYVGVSLDGMAATHDNFRRMEGAFDESMHGIRLCKARGIKVGIRFTLTQDNAHDLPALAAADGRRRAGQVLPLPSQLRRARQQEPQGRRLSPDHARGHGPAVRHLLARPAGGQAEGIRHRQQRRRRRLSAALGAANTSRIWKTTSAPSWSSGAATPPA